MDQPPTPGPPKPYTELRAPNFIVRCDDPLLTRAVANEADFQRREVAKQWLGMELPNWEKPCEVRVNRALTAEGGVSTFEFGEKKASIIVLPDQPVLLTARIDLGGSIGSVLYNHLPREVTHAVLATYFGVPPPRWVDTGISRLSEYEYLQARLDDRLRTLLKEGRAYRLRALFRMTEFPKQSEVFIAQSHSVVRFLLTRQALLKGPGVGYADDQQTRRMLSTTRGPLGAWTYTFDPRNGRQSLIAFAWFAAALNYPVTWDRAAQVVYGFESVNELEEAWLEWLKKPESKNIGRRYQEPPPPNTDKPDLIPPTKLPDGKR